MSCFGVGNVNIRCMKVWRSYLVAKLLATGSATSIDSSQSLEICRYISTRAEKVGEDKNQ